MHVVVQVCMHPNVVVNGPRVLSPAVGLLLTDDASRWRRRSWLRAISKPELTSDPSAIYFHDSLATSISVNVLLQCSATCPRTCASVAALLLPLPEPPLVRLPRTHPPPRLATSISPHRLSPPPLSVSYRTRRRSYRPPAALMIPEIRH